MKILHTADLHLGQVIYQHYDRSDEHRHFFRQLERWCREERPDALLVSGDVFDMQQPSASVKKAFTNYFVELHRQCPAMTIVITAGNHDSASRLEADSAVWDLAGIRIVGMPPSADRQEHAADWQEHYIVRLTTGYVVALPYMTGERQALVQSVLDKVTAENTTGLPVVVMAHQAVTGLDASGHNFEVGSLKTQDVSTFGTGFDYLALGHIHKPQTIGHQEDCMEPWVSYQAPVARYAGSALHVSCDEAYPHTVSLVELHGHGGRVDIRQLRIDELRHFYVLPADASSYASSDEALAAISLFAETTRSGYLRLRMDYAAPMPPNFAQMVYDLFAAYDDELRYNPKIIWTGVPSGSVRPDASPAFEVADLQQMTDPMVFVEKTKDHYAGLDLDEVRTAFEAVKAEILLMEEESLGKAVGKPKKADKTNDTQAK